MQESGMGVGVRRKRRKGQEEKRQRKEERGWKERDEEGMIEGKKRGKKIIPELILREPHQKNLNQ